MVKMYLLALCVRFILTNNFCICSSKCNKAFVYVLCAPYQKKNNEKYVLFTINHNKSNDYFHCSLNSIKYIGYQNVRLHFDVDDWNGKYQRLCNYYNAVQFKYIEALHFIKRTILISNSILKSKFPSASLNWNDISFNTKLCYCLHMSSISWDMKLKLNFWFHYKYLQTIIILYYFACQAIKLGNLQEANDGYQIQKEYSSFLHVIKIHWILSISLNELSNHNKMHKEETKANYAIVKQKILCGFTLYVWVFEANKWNEMTSIQ